MIDRDYNWRKKQVDKRLKRNLYIYINRYMNRTFKYTRSYYYKDLNNTQIRNVSSLIGKYIYIYSKNGKFLSHRTKGRYSLNKDKGGDSCFDRNVENAKEKSRNSFKRYIRNEEYLYS